MVRFCKHKEMVLDCKKQDLIVLDITTMAALEAHKINRRLKQEFPETFRDINLSAYRRELEPGKLHLTTENDYFIALIVASDRDVGFIKQSDLEVKVNYEKCIDEIVNTALIENLNITSPILGRGRKLWNHIEKYINTAHSAVAWNIYPD